jgi:hypothetical protein
MFQFKFKDRANAANILAAALEDFLEEGERRRRKKNTLIVVSFVIIRDNIELYNTLSVKMHKPYPLHLENA